MANLPKVLVVDDEPHIIKIIEARLKTQNLEVITAPGGEEALELIKKDTPDLIVLDLLMPPPNGFQVCRTLKDSEEYSHIPIILLTAKTTEDDMFWGNEAGADAFVVKPYEAETLLNKINELLEKK